MLDRVRVENSEVGISFGGVVSSGPIAATVRDSISAGNTFTGIKASKGGFGSDPTTVTVHRSASVNNSTGISAEGSSATIRIGNSTVTGNAFGLSSPGGAIISYGTNKVNGNGTDGAPTSPVIPMK